MARSARSARFCAARIATALFFIAPLDGGAGVALAAPAAPGALHPYAAHVTEASLRFGIPEPWIWRVMHVESRGNARALSHAGAMGVMQIMPATWAMLTARHGLGADPYDVRANILGGAAYLRAMWDRYGNVRLMLAAYNAGPGRADAYAAGRRGLPAETIAYVAAIAPAIGASSIAPLAPAPHREAPASPSALQERVHCRTSFACFAVRLDEDAKVPAHWPFGGRRSKSQYLGAISRGLNLRPLSPRTDLKADRPQPAIVSHLAQARGAPAPDKPALLFAHSAGSIFRAVIDLPLLLRR